MPDRRWPAASADPSQLCGRLLRLLFSLLAAVSLVASFSVCSIGNLQIHAAGRTAAAELRAPYSSSPTPPWKDAPRRVALESAAGPAARHAVYSMRFLGSASRMTPAALNDGGEVVGSPKAGRGRTHGFAYASGHITDLGTFRGLPNMEATDVNIRGMIDGLAWDGLGRWAPGTRRTALVLIPRPQGYERLPLRAGSRMVVTSLGQIDGRGTLLATNARFLGRGMLGRVRLSFGSPAVEGIRAPALCRSRSVTAGPTPRSS